MDFDEIRNDFGEKSNPTRPSRARYAFILQSNTTMWFVNGVARDSIYKWFEKCNAGEFFRLGAGIQQRSCRV